MNERKAKRANQTTTRKEDNDDDAPPLPSKSHLLFYSDDPSPFQPLSRRPVDEMRPRSHSSQSIDSDNPTSSEDFEYALVRHERGEEEKRKKLR